MTISISFNVDVILVKKFWADVTQQKHNIKIKIQVENIKRQIIWGKTLQV